MTIKYNNKTTIAIEKIGKAYTYAVERKSGRKGVPAKYTMATTKYTRRWTAKRGAFRALNRGE